MANVNLKYRVVNAGVAINEVNIEVDGEPAVVQQRKLYVDAEPLDSSGKTLELVLPVAQVDDFAIDAILSVKISVDAAAPAVSEKDVTNG